jgi:GAF domain-containing protein
MPNSSDPITDPGRLAALRRTGLLDSPPEEAFDQLARVAAKVMDAPIALVSLVDEDRQFFKSSVGGHTGNLGAEQETPLSYSLCREAVATKAPLILRDARADPRFGSHPAVRSAGVAAYAGMPIVLADGHAIGTVCVLDTKPRDWNEDQVRALASLATDAATALVRRAAAADAEAHRAAARGRPAQHDPLLAAADILAAAVSFYLTQLGAYADGLTEPGAGTREGVVSEAQRRAAVVSAEASLLRALEAFGKQAVEGKAEREEDITRQARAAVVLRDRCAAFLAAEKERNRVSLQFRRNAVPFEDFERVAAEASSAEDAMRVALRDYEL